MLSLIDEDFAGGGPDVSGAFEKSAEGTFDDGDMGGGSMRFISVESAL